MQHLLDCCAYGGEEIHKLGRLLNIADTLETSTVLIAACL